MKETKAEKRERIKKNRSKMSVTGAGLRNIMRIKITKAEAARKGRSVV